MRGLAPGSAQVRVHTLMHPVSRDVLSAPAGPEPSRGTCAAPLCLGPGRPFLVARCPPTWQTTCSSPDTPSLPPDSCLCPCSKDPHPPPLSSG